MSTIGIVPAGSRHAAGIHGVARAVRFDRSDLDPERGFLVLPETPTWWARTLARSRHSFVATDGDRVVGFVYAYVDEVHDELKIDRIAVLPQEARRGIAQQLLDAALASSPTPRSSALILHRPVRNRASISFFRDRNGYRLADTLEADDAAPGLDRESFVWGVYARP